MNREMKFRAGVKQPSGRIYWEEFSLSCNDQGAIREQYFEKQYDTPWRQFTGLKDKNEKEIYEGDILKDIDGILWRVDWSISGFNIFCNTKNLLKKIERKKNRTITEEEEDAELIGLWSFNKEIISNICENPKLFGTDKEDKA